MSQPFLTDHRKLAKLDPRLKPLIKHVGPCNLELRTGPFQVLAKSIIAQQISGKAAESISKRVIALCGKKGISATRLEELPDDQLRACGLSANKLLSLRSLSKHFLENKSLVRKLPTMSDEEVIESLLPVRGVGVWTAQMFLMFCLGRPDVLPVADLGLRAGVRDVFELPDLPAPAALTEIGEAWRPFRSVATWYFWRSRGWLETTKEST